MLTVDRVSLRFGAVRALDDVSLRVAEGEICGLIGPNGAGKTTLFNCVTRVYRPDRGAIAVDGADLLRVPPHRVVRLGVARTYQNLALFPSLTVLENTMVGAHSRDPAHLLPALTSWPSTVRRRHRLEREAMAILADLELDGQADHRAAGLPFGTLKRVELARALAARPRLLLLDEPAGGLAQSEVRELAALILRLRTEHRLTVLIVEHHVGLVSELSDHVVAMDAGRVIADGTPEAVRTDPLVVTAYLGRAS